MQVGDLVCWKADLSLVGIIIKVGGEGNHFWHCKVQWSTGEIFSHSNQVIQLLETSETS